MRLAWRRQLSIQPQTINVGVIVAVLLASLAAGFVGGFIVWVVWRYDLLNAGGPRRYP
jgi:nitrate reductase NapE component